VHFAEVNLAAAGLYADIAPSARNGDIAASSFQLGAPANLSGAHVTATGPQRSVSGNIAYVDVTASRESREVTCNIENLDVSALRLQPGDRAAGRRIAESRAADSPSTNVSTLSVEARRTADILCFNVAGFGVHFDAIAGRDSYFKLHPELSIGLVGRLRGKRTGDFHAGAEGARFERIIVQELLRRWAPGIGFNVYGVPHHWRGTGFQLENFHGTEVSRQPKCQAVPGFQSAGANNRGMSSGRFWIFCRLDARALDPGAS
jgi:hypothetical protein